MKKLRYQFTVSLKPNKGDSDRNQFMLIEASCCDVSGNGTLHFYHLQSQYVVAAFAPGSWRSVTSVPIAGVQETQ